MASEPVWLASEQIVTVNRLLVAATGEPFGVRDTNLLESACARPRQHWSYGEDDVARLISALLFGIARNHPFVQGNKRTAFAAAVIFAEVNGYRVAVPDTSTFADAIVAVIDGELGQEVFIELLREHLTALNG